MAECEEIIQMKKINRQHPVYKFTTENEKNEIRCIECDHKFPDHHAGNIRKHIQNKHTHKSVELNKLIEEYYHPKSVATNNNENHRSRRGKNEEHFIKVVHDVREIKKGMVEMCSVDMGAFHQLRNSGFSRIMEPIIQEARKYNIPLSTKPEALHTYSSEQFSKMRHIIKGELEGKFFSIMVDATTTQNRSFFGILAQFMENDRVHTAHT